MTREEEIAYLRQINVQREIGLNAITAKTHPAVRMEAMAEERKKEMDRPKPPPPVKMAAPVDQPEANRTIAEPGINVRGRYRDHNPRRKIPETELAANERLRVHHPDGSTEIAPAGLKSVNEAWANFPDSNQIDRVTINGKGVPVAIHKLKKRTSRG
ncbi:hypothetical protein GO003_018980 [Methylicorpusculum oleiharenae]|uniref:hypothetical protein n=1 Tax=Methylicorpusculum oleiharenae TaxID=1338687 RepID=UPI00135C0916|nr:hypothetical protein [Methylicorpusculum oleiharenae]MCD2452472.1 hypothetical protein [Methylicorpusculum oleiharenae]